MTDAQPLFLGLDLSTQQLKAILVDEDSVVVHESAVGFDRDLPHYGTINGAIRGPDDGEVTSPVAMWLEAMDLLLQRMKDAGVNMNDIQAVSGAGQQHGSVYWSHNAEKLLGSLDAGETLLAQLAPAAFSSPNAPIWQDSSTTRECQELEEAVGGAQALADLTGSRAYERFTGTQIKRARLLPPEFIIRHLRPEVYDATSRISLVSSFIPSLFLGSIAPIEISDASGMNLMNVLTCKWDDNLLDTCGGPELRSKLGPEPVPGGTVLGTVSSWWTEKWAFSPDCMVAPFTGDNPATMVALSTPGDAVLSLGTSTTFLLSIPPAETAPARFTTSHLLSHPTTPDAQIAMLCYKNGALAREQVRDKYASRSWDTYNTLVEQTPPGNNGYWGYYFPLPEIIPPGVKGDYFFKGSDMSPVVSIPDSTHPRAILESQLLSIRSRVAAILPTSAPPLHRLVLTGGSSANQVIRQLAADVFGMNAYVAEDTKEAAGTGGAILAKFAWWRAQNGGLGTFEEMRAADVERLRRVASPKADVTKVYDALVEPYRVGETWVARACAQ
ncbi:actin-like ATPase domain-containing protein [Vararia minispora EC-137]|uniref:Actin-like ATPase domain-containing protein n=1 Tax=Vararia minispora EC-137 TaxID=1314806 RepID=A0ACB8QI14_9AGAM|nr:actin-like ATPase domain-containing protein [Vararia minispora EC-137]